MQNINTPPMGQPQSNVPPPLNNINGPRIKPEPGLDSPTVSQPPFQNPLLTMPNATPAQQRAAQNLQASYGPRAAASINAIQGNASQQSQTPQQHMQQMQHQQQAMQHQHMQQVQQQRAAQLAGPKSQITQDQYRQAMAAQAAQAQQRLHSQNGVNGAQTDGAGDEVTEYIGVIKQFDAQGEEVAAGRIEIDNMIRKKIEAMGQTMEGGGLMLPLHETTKSAKRQRNVKTSSSSAQVDGPGSDEDEDNKDNVKDEDLDDDAINSDLDDPDDGLNDDEDDDEGMGHIMLCMYDKVQRVKNKWYALPPTRYIHSCLLTCSTGSA